jgi:hypothetical protein
MQAPVHAPATADMARNIWNERVLEEICTFGGASGAPPFDATAQTNMENMVQVVVTKDYAYRLMSVKVLPVRVVFGLLGLPTTASTG